MRRIVAALTLSLLGAGRPTIAMSPVAQRTPPPRIVQLYRETIIPGQRRRYDAVERDAARICVQLGCPHPHLALLAAQPASGEVWWVNAFADSAEQERVTRGYTGNLPLTAALNAVVERKSTLVTPPVNEFLHVRGDGGAACSWDVAGARFLVVNRSASAATAHGCLFDDADGRVVALTWLRTRRAADAALAELGSGSVLFAVEPTWGMPSRPWMAADPEFWRVNPAAQVTSRRRDTTSDHAALRPRATAKRPEMPVRGQEWLDDFASLKRSLERHYSHLAWFGSPQGGIDLPALHRATMRSLLQAHSDSEAATALRSFVAAIHDGHLTPTVVASTTLPEPPTVDAAEEMHTGCAAYGYAPLTRVVFSRPFESLPGFRLLSDGVERAFRGGTITVGHTRIGILRIPRFRPAEYPEMCLQTWRAIVEQGRAPTRAAILDEINARFLRTLAARLRELQVQGLNALVVDVGGDGGGNDLGDWAVRLFTPTPVPSAPMLLSASTVALPYLDEQLAELQFAVDSAGPLSAGTAERLQSAIGSFRGMRAAAQSASCDMSWVWRERRDWRTTSCKNLVPAAFASGALAYAAPGTIDAGAVRALYWPSLADTLRGVWSGRTYVLTDNGTGSSAEMFTALMRDRNIARTVGTRTAGSGCGFMVHDKPVTLPHSKLSFRVPNCVRLRGDGTDEVAGIAPDLPVVGRPGEGARSLAARLLDMIAADLRSTEH